MKINLEEAPQKKLRPIRYTIIAIMIVGIMIVAGSIIPLRWAYQSTDVLQYKNEPFPVRTIREHPTAEGVVILKINYCKLAAVKGEVRISFVSEKREYFLPIAMDEQPIQCNGGRTDSLDGLEVPVIIPKDVLPDKYVVKIVATYNINPFKKGVREIAYSQPFEVVQ